MGVHCLCSSHFIGPGINQEFSTSCSCLLCREAEKPCNTVNCFRCMSKCTSSWGETQAIFKGVTDPRKAKQHCDSTRSRRVSHLTTLFKHQAEQPVDIPACNRKESCYVTRCPIYLSYSPRRQAGFAPSSFKYLCNSLMWAECSFTSVPQQQASTS